MNQKQVFLQNFATTIRTILKQVEVPFTWIQEIRLRVQAPLLIIYQNQEYYLSSKGMLTKEKNKAYIVSKQELKETMETMSHYSLYAFEEEVKQGFLTIQGGHRVGIAGKVVLDGTGIRSMKYISFINVRLCHQVKDCASSVIPYLYEQGNMVHTLIISPPRCGKTTLLRDMIRQISDGTRESNGVTVGVVDERSELGACYQGIPQNDLGIRTDVLDCCPKAQGMLMMIRSMSPMVIAVDEIGGMEDLKAMEYVRNAGCKIIATMHGNKVEDALEKSLTWFERYIVLGRDKQIGNIVGIYDQNGTKL